MISIVIPLYNERDNILTYRDELFPKIDRIAGATGESFQYVMVDDGSRDDTYPLLQGLARERSDVIAVTNGTNKGMGAAIKHGLQYCKGDLVVTMDSDLTFRPEDVEALIAAYRASHPDCVSGSPYLKQGLMEEVSFIRFLPSKVVNTLYQILLGAKITCVSPIFRLYRKDVLDEIRIQSNNFEINAEILAKLILSGRSVVEVPVVLHTRRYGESKINVSKEIRNHVRLLTKIFKIRVFKGNWD
ncbi:Undecaprenyl-phosphate 4-deoxy-4-formamido-L-arabinose transferase [Methanoculleus chikugoensis]|uniref:Undecaprenyl-phosphate 4-deoxy-4-formamido-L-arabinose transferase n=1 Tax=Methanoculleus chikugoensis TaxID=118126 RepID=A0A1M4ML75_9EURY|nr:glycosyltransferase [Methanoculleus chikugoensis]SCL75643.1 Undecaprenyl-phosphate 4-deoxy-4-formamido-L-arabinose transferase [Methanoculleus chikugoensis]